MGVAANNNHVARGVGSGGSGERKRADSLRGRLQDQYTRSRGSSTASQTSTTPSEAGSAFTMLRNEKVVASGSGITAMIGLAEPVLFLEGFDRNKEHARKTTMLRGALHIKVTKPTKIKKIYLGFKGIVNTNWPEAKKGQFNNTHSIMNHTWPFFDYQFENCEHSYGADHVKLAKPGSSLVKEVFGSPTRAATVDVRSTTSLDLGPKEIKRLSLQNTPSRSASRGEAVNGGSTVAQKGFKMFRPGDYIYNFELPIDSKLPETIRLESSSVKYQLDLNIERSGAFRPNLVGTKELLLIRTPCEGSLEQVEPIAISRTWDDQLHYDIIISGKAFPMGAKIPISFKLTPLSKVALHRVKVYVTETVQQYSADRSFHRLDASKQILLFEKRASCPMVSAYDGSEVRILSGGGVEYADQAATARGEDIVYRGQHSLLGDPEGDYGVGLTEMEVDVQLPTCSEMNNRDTTQRLHCDTAFENIEVHHWIKVVLRLSKPPERPNLKPKYYEISIDSPLHILSCLANQSNMYLPSYTSPSSFPAEEYDCQCRDAKPVSRAPASITAVSSLLDSSTPSSDENYQPTPTITPTNGSPNNNKQAPRPMHLLRLPSYSPPAFETAQPQPPPPPRQPPTPSLFTPPPDYFAVVQTGATDALEDYFARLHCAESEYDDNARGSGRVDVPLTPGGRVHRSMEMPREWLRVGEIGAE